MEIRITSTDVIGRLNEQLEPYGLKVGTITSYENVPPYIDELVVNKCSITEENGGKDE